MILYKLKKKYAKHQIIFEENFEMDSNGWFISINYIKKKGIEQAHLIIRDDIDVWLRVFIKNGWEIIEDE